MRSRHLASISVAAALSGCLLPEPSYDDTRFRCEEPAQSCPDGFACIDGWCERPGGGADAGQDDPDPPDSPADAAPDDDPDADTQQTSSFGERPGTSFDGVTTDTTLRFDDPTGLYGDDDIIGIDADPIHIGLLRFDLSSLPADAQVLAAELDLYAGNPIESGQYEVHVMLLSWDEAEANYVERAAGVLWPSPGAGAGSFAPSPIATLVAADVGNYTVSLPASVVQTWVSTPAQNNGLRWSADSPDGRGGNFDSRESPEAVRRPRLRVTWR